MNIKTEVNGSVGIATLNRPDALNALNTPLLDELAEALEAWDRGSEVRCMIVTGSERAFAAGADIREMAPKSYMGICTRRTSFRRRRRPHRRPGSR